MPNLGPANRSVEQKRAGGTCVSHRLYAAREDAECMAGLRAAELLSVGATATTGTATSPLKPRKSAAGKTRFWTADALRMNTESRTDDRKRFLRKHFRMRDG